jgi:hypothetical protein
VGSLLFGGRKLVQVCRTGCGLSRGTLNKLELSNSLNRLKIDPNSIAFCDKNPRPGKTSCKRRSAQNGYICGRYDRKTWGVQGNLRTLGGYRRRLEGRLFLFDLIRTRWLNELDFCLNARSV